jgi:hypothetical protein
MPNCQICQTSVTRRIRCHTCNLLVCYPCLFSHQKDHAATQRHRTQHAPDAPKHSGLRVEENISKCIICGSARDVIDEYLGACPKCGDVRRKITIGKTIVI